jgi:hypothetical protein
MATKKAQSKSKSAKRAKPRKRSKPKVKTLKDQPFAPGEEVAFRRADSVSPTPTVHATVLADRTLNVSLEKGEWIAIGPAGTQAGDRYFEFTVK